MVDDGPILKPGVFAILISSQGESQQSSDLILKLLAEKRALNGVKGLVRRPDLFRTCTILNSGRIFYLRIFALWSCGNTDLIPQVIEVTGTKELELLKRVGRWMFRNCRS